MLKEIQVRNFRCLRKVTVPLKPLTVLIGPNDSGKSTFLDAVESLVIAQTKFQQSDFWKLDSTKTIDIRGTTNQGSLDTKSVTDGLSPIVLDEQRPRNLILPMARYQLPSTGLSMECKGYSKDEEAILPINEDGTGVPALLDYLLRRDRVRFFKVVEAFRASIPGFEDLQIATPEPHLRRIDLVIDHGLQLRSDLASAGVRIMLFFVAIAHHPRPPRLILLEEPENGIHPKRIADVVRLLRELTRGKFGERPAQIIVTTHSPYLLDCVDLSEDQVLVFRRNDDGSRGADPVDANRMKTFLDEFKLGEIWFNEDEEGLVAKS